jgi:hypothetical protein
MNCRKVNSQLADLFLDPESAPAELRRHVEGCPACSRELTELRSTMGLLDDWAVEEANPFFDAKLMARLRAEQQAEPVGLLERWKAWLVYGSSLRMRPLMAGALAVIILAGGGTYADLAWQANHHAEESAAVRDLQSLEGNAQVFQQLDSVDQSTDQQNQDSGSASPSSD